LHGLVNSALSWNYTMPNGNN